VSHEILPHRRFFLHRDSRDVFLQPVCVLASRIALVTLEIKMNGAPIFTYDFVMGQLRIALVAALAYSGGKGWLTPTDATLLTTVATALGPLIIPWAWSVAVNYGVVHVASGSAAAKVAAVEKTEPAIANAAAVTATVKATAA
jgi:hypothetical protein